MHRAVLLAALPSLVSCVPPQTSEESPKCLQSEHCIIVGDEYDCEPGYRWEDPNDIDNFRCVRDTSDDESGSGDESATRTADTSEVDDDSEAETEGDSTSDDSSQDETVTNVTEDSQSEQTQIDESQTTSSGDESQSEEDSPLCADGLQLCGDDCVDLQTSHTHCGGCNQGCDDDELCDEGECQANSSNCVVEGCPDDYYCHLGSENCLPGCGSDDDCGTNERCDAATHECVCKSGFHDCGGSCVSDSSTDTCDDNCSPCWEPDHGEAICTESGCGFTCDDDALACDGDCAVCPNDWAASTYSCRNDGSCAIASCTEGYVPCNDGEDCCACDDDERWCDGVCASCPDGAATTMCSHWGYFCLATSCDDGLTLSDDGECIQCASDPGTVYAGDGENDPCAVVGCQSGYVRCDGACCPVDVDTIMEAYGGERSIAAALTHDDERSLLVATSFGGMRLWLADDDDDTGDFGHFSEFEISGIGVEDRVDIEPAIKLNTSSWSDAIATVTMHSRFRDYSAGVWRHVGMTCDVEDQSWGLHCTDPRVLKGGSFYGSSYDAEYADSFSYYLSGRSPIQRYAWQFVTTEAGFDETAVVLTDASEYLEYSNSTELFSRPSIKEIISTTTPFNDAYGLVVSSSGADVLLSSLSTDQSWTDVISGGVNSCDIAYRKVDDDDMLVVACQDDDGELSIRRTSSADSAEGDAHWLTSWNYVSTSYLTESGFDKLKGEMPQVAIGPNGRMHIVVRSAQDGQADLLHLDSSGDWLVEPLPSSVVAETDVHRKPLAYDIRDDGESVVFIVDDEGAVVRMRFYTGAYAQNASDQGVDDDGNDSSSNEDDNDEGDDDGDDSGNGGDNDEADDDDGWTCPASYYDDAWCDCGCGSVDVDCPLNATVDDCEYVGCIGDVDPDDVTQCL